MAALLLLTGFTLSGSSADYENAREKITLIAGDKAPRGETIFFTPAEVQAYTRGEFRRQKVQGVRDVNVKLGEDLITWSGLINFARIPQLASLSSNWLLSGLLQGEKPLVVVLHLVSGAGKATINVEKVVISDTTFEGGALDFLVEKLILADYPEASIGEPFELEHNVEQIRVRSSGIRVKIRG